MESQQIIFRKRIEDGVYYKNSAFKSLRVKCPQRQQFLER